MEEQRPPIESYRLEAELYEDGKIIITERHCRETYDEKAFDEFKDPKSKPSGTVQKWHFAIAIFAIFMQFLAVLFAYWLNH